MLNKVQCKLSLAMEAAASFGIISLLYHQHMMAVLKCSSERMFWFEDM